MSLRRVGQMSSALLKRVRHHQMTTTTTTMTASLGYNKVLASRLFSTSSLAADE